jgi:hypothetical protein
MEFGFLFLLELYYYQNTPIKMARGQKSFKHNNNSAAVTDDETYMIVMLYTYQHKSLDYLARKFNVSSSTAKEIIIRSRFGGACG